MDKYAQMKMFHYECHIQVYMYDFIHADPETMSEEDYFLGTNIFFANYKQMSTPGPVPKHWLGFSYMLS